MIKDEIGNQVYQTMEDLREAPIPALKRYWDDAAGVLRLIGREWIQIQANFMLPTQLSY